MKSFAWVLGSAAVALCCSVQDGFESTDNWDEGNDIASRGEALRSGGFHHHGPTALRLSGDLRAHDPALIRHGRKAWFVFSTGDPAVGGGTVQIRKSSNLREWSYAGNVFDSIPTWITDAIPGVRNLWAPEVVEHDGTYYLYYAASTFGSNRSLIALATNTTLDPDDPDYEWVDRGLVTESFSTDDYNAIDPAVGMDDDGPRLAFGSFWSGVRMLSLEWPSGKPAPDQDDPLRLADRLVPPNAIEAPAIVERRGWYYLFVSFDFCCRGTGSTYKIAVGRSRTIDGPYFDRLGTPLQHGGGTVVLSERGNMFGPGGQSVYGDYLAHHFYDGTAGGDFRLAIRRIHWDKDGWPELAEPAREDELLPPNAEPPGGGSDGGAPTGVLAQYSFDEGAGTAAMDSSGNANHATLVNGAGFTTGRTGVGGALLLNNPPGGTQYLQLPPALLADCQDFTMATWMFLNRPNQPFARLLDADGTLDGFVFFTPTAGNDLFFNIFRVPPGADQGVGTTYPGGAVPFGAWHHVAVTLEGDTGTLYFDGNAIASNPALVFNPSDISYNLGNPATHTWVGRSLFPVDPNLDAALDDLLFSCEAYSADQIAELAQ